jgi:hypothetical protein
MDQVVEHLSLNPSTTKKKIVSQKWPISQFSIALTKNFQMEVELLELLQTFQKEVWK